MHMKPISLAIAASLCLGCIADVSAEEAKYIFYFIGDGMGPNQIALTEYMRGELADSVGLAPLAFTQWPVATLASTYSTSARVTDSAASGTALASGHKTANGCIGVLDDKTTPVKSIAERARDKGLRVGIASSVGVNHATPAAFYGHNSSRSNYNALARDLAVSGFEFFAGPDFYGHGKDTVGVYDYARSNGYTITRGLDDFKLRGAGADKVIMLQPAETTARLASATLPSAIDRRPGDMTLRDLVTAGIDYLYTHGDDDDAPGFFFMVEGGNIDWHCHSNDAATVAREVEDFDNAISAAFDFYLRHPDETLIIVTADHETGSLSLGTGAYALNLKILANQKVSESEMSRILNNIRKNNDGNITWEQAEQALTENFGFFTPAVKLSDKQTERLRQAFYKSFFGENGEVRSEYRTDLALAAEAKRIINELALVGWGSGGHSATFVPVYAVGAGSHNFTSRTDNAQIARKIAEAGGFPVTH